MQWFSFGERREVTTRSGGTKVVGELALHVQCAWRIVRGDVIVVGIGDLWAPADEKIDVPNDFDWRDVLTRRDRRMARLLENETRALLVQEVEVGDAGAMRIVLEDGLALEVFPSDSLDGEYWRLFRPAVDEAHLVVTGRGLESGNGVEA
jgi:hypothetical protein